MATITYRIVLNGEIKNSYDVFYAQVHILDKIEQLLSKFINNSVELDDTSNPFGLVSVCLEDGYVKYSFKPYSIIERATQLLVLSIIHDVILCKINNEKW